MSSKKAVGGVRTAGEVRTLDAQKLPARAPEDGAVRVASPRADVFTIYVCDHGEDQEIRMSRYNAYRVFGCLAMMLGFQLPASIGKRIKL